MRIHQRLSISNRHKTRHSSNHPPNRVSPQVRKWKGISLTSPMWYITQTRVPFSRTISTASRLALTLTIIKSHSSLSHWWTWSWAMVSSFSGLAGKLSMSRPNNSIKTWYLSRTPPQWEVFPPIWWNSPRQVTSVWELGIDETSCVLLFTEINSRLRSMKKFRS